LKIQVEHFKDFKEQLEKVRKAEAKCQSLIEEHTDIETEQFRVSTREGLNALLDARKEFNGICVISPAFVKF